MFNLNRVTIAGNITRDPELTHTKGGTAKTRLDVAVNRSFKGQNGDWVDEVTYIPVIAWSKQAESAAQYLKKGRGVFVEGRLTIDKWDGKDGEKVTFAYITASSIQFGPRKPDEQNGERIDEEAEADDDNVFV